MVTEIPAASYSHYAGSGPLVTVGTSPYVHTRGDTSYLSNPVDGNNVFAVTFPGVPAGPVTILVRGWVLDPEFDFFAGVNVGDGVTDLGGGNYSLNNDTFTSFSTGWNEYTTAHVFTAPGGTLTVYGSMGFAIDAPDTVRISYMAVLVDEVVTPIRRTHPRDDRRRTSPSSKAIQSGRRTSGGYP